MSGLAGEVGALADPERGGEPNTELEMDTEEKTSVKRLYAERALLRLARLNRPEVDVDAAGLAGEGDRSEPGRGP